MEVGVFPHQNRSLGRERFHILAVFNDRQPLAMLVRADAIQAFQHLVALDEESALGHMIIRENRAPNRVRMQHGAGAGAAHDR